MKKFCSVLMALIVSFGMFTFSPTAQAAAEEMVAGIVATSSGRLNVRSAQSTSSSVVASLNKGSYLP